MSPASASANPLQMLASFLMPRIDLERSFELGDGVVESALTPVNEPEQIVSIGVVRPQPDGLAGVDSRLCQPFR